MFAVSNFQGVPAPLSILAFLGTGLGGVTLVLVTIGLLLARRPQWAVRTALVGAAGIVMYGVLLFGTAMASHDIVLSPGGEKYFCELDCHLAYSILEVTRPEALGPPAAPVRARGTWLVVRLRTRFDETTISPHRGNASLQPNPRRVELVDALGRRFTESGVGWRALEAAGGAGPPLTRELRPGESYTTTLAFDVPADCREPRLLLTESDAVTGFLIGHENSPWHGKVAFRLGDDVVR